MLEQQRAWQGSAEGARWAAKRDALPVVQIRQGLLDALREHDVAVVGGDTGCGKTTQVRNLGFIVVMSGGFEGFSGGAD